MKWVLVIITFYSPNVPLSILELEYDTPAACEAQLEEFEVKFAQADSNFRYALRCEERKQEEQ